MLRSTRAYRVATGQPVGPPLRPGGLIVDAAFSPDGKSVATLGARDGQVGGGAGDRGLGLGERPAAMAGGTTLRPPEPVLPPRRPPPRRALRRRGVTALRPRRGSRGHPLEAHDAEPAAPLDQQRQGRVQPRWRERADLGDGKRRPCLGRRLGPPSLPTFVPSRQVPRPPVLPRRPAHGARFLRRLGSGPRTSRRGPSSSSCLPIRTTHTPQLSAPTESC